MLRISLIIPAYNEERYLARCLDAVAAQKQMPDEVIVVDNRSTDHTSEIAARYPFVTVLTESKRGRVYARNTGFTYASGEILARIDADAVLPPNWTQRIAAHFDQSGSERTAWTGAALFYNVRFPRLVSRIYDGFVFAFNRILIGHPSLWGSNMAITKASWLEVAPNVCLRNDVHEDLDLAIHLHRHKYRIVYDPHTRVHVQLRRVRSSRHELWDYLQMWPRTLRVHGLKTWVLCWIFGDILLYAVTPMFSISERVARSFGRSPLED